MQQITIPIDGMTCGGCVRNVQHALDRIPGVRVEKVAVGSATLSYDPAVVDSGSLFAAIEGAGYKPRAA